MRTCRLLRNQVELFGFRPATPEGITAISRLRKTKGCILALSSVIPAFLCLTTLGEMKETGHGPLSQAFLIFLSVVFFLSTIALLDAAVRMVRKSFAGTLPIDGNKWLSFIGMCGTSFHAKNYLAAITRQGRRLTEEEYEFFRAQQETISSRKGTNP